MMLLTFMTIGHQFKAQLKHNLIIIVLQTSSENLRYDLLYFGN